VSAETNESAPKAAGGKVPAVRRRFQKGTFVKRNGVWFGQWREYVTLPDGTQRAENHSKTFPGMSERAARATFDLILVKINASNGAEAEKAIPKAGRTLEDGVKEWRKLVAVNHKPRGRETTESHLRAHILPKLGSLAVADLTAQKLQTFVAEITPGRSGKMVENIMLTLTGILRHVRKWGWTVPQVSISDLSMPEKVKAVVRTIEAADIRRLIAAADEPLKTILCVLASTGMRINEVLALKLDDLDFRRKTISIRHSAYNGTLGSPKSEASKADVPMPDALAKILRGFIDGKNYRKNDLGLLFCNRRNRPYSDNKLREKDLRPLLESLKIRRIGFHAFRHAVASELIEGGAPITVVRDQLRHSDVRITLGIYGHVIGDSQRRAVNRLAKRLVA
jgi:integrase